MRQFAWPWVPLLIKNPRLDEEEKNKESFFLKTLADAREDEREINDDSLDDCCHL